MEEHNNKTGDIEINYINSDGKTIYTKTYWDCIATMDNIDNLDYSDNSVHNINVTIQYGGVERKVNDKN